MDPRLLDQLKQVTPEENELLRGRGEIDRAIYMQQNSQQVDKVNNEMPRL